MGLLVKRVCIFQTMVKIEIVVEVLAVVDMVVQL
jgi:hypothetical protein